MAKAKVKVIRESSTGLNIRVDVNGTTYTNNQAYSRSEKGLIPGYHVVNRDGTKFIRSNPGSSKSNNLRWLRTRSRSKERLHFHLLKVPLQFQMFMLENKNPTTGF